MWFFTNKQDACLSIFLLFSIWWFGIEIKRIHHEFVVSSKQIENDFTETYFQYSFVSTNFSFLNDKKIYNSFSEIEPLATKYCPLETDNCMTTSLHSFNHDPPPITITDGTFLRDFLEILKRTFQDLKKSLRDVSRNYM